GVREVGRETLECLFEIAFIHRTVRQAQAALATAAERRAWNRDDIRLLEEMRRKGGRIGTSAYPNEREEAAIRWRPFEPRHLAHCLGNSLAAARELCMKASRI